jgi:hypothetical protein
MYKYISWELFQMDSITVILSVQEFAYKSLDM